MPGWDGLQTAKEIRKIDPKVQIFFVTAYSDHGIEDIISEVGGDIGYLSKPFNNEEILQLAIKGIYDWTKLLNLERLLENVSKIGTEGAQLKHLLNNILGQISDYVDSEESVLYQLHGKGSYEELARIGVLNHETVFKEILDENPEGLPPAVVFMKGVLVCKMDHFCVLTVPKHGENYNQENVYLLQLFVQNAVRAINNAELTDRLLQNEKLSAVGQAISMVMHDIRTPIGQIQTLVDLLTFDDNLSEDSLDLVNMMKESSHSAMDIIHDVLDFIRNGKMQKEHFELQEFILKLQKQFEQHYKDQNISISTQISDDVKLFADEKKIKRVVSNLVNNAVEAMQHSNTVNPHITISEKLIGNTIQMEVADNGPGIPDEIKEKLFEPFVTHGKPKGSGLGLAIAHQFMKAHEGSIEVDSSSEGTTFRLIFPSEFHAKE
jgi:nitrogen-specific signal transduction histidine kinase